MTASPSAPRTSRHDHETFSFTPDHYVSPCASGWTGRHLLQSLLVRAQRAGVGGASAASLFPFPSRERSEPPRPVYHVVPQTPPKSEPTSRSCIAQLTCGLPLLRRSSPLARLFSFSPASSASERFLRQPFNRHCYRNPSCILGGRHGCIGSVSLSCGAGSSIVAAIFANRTRRCAIRHSNANTDRAGRHTVAD